MSFVSIILTCYNGSQWISRAIQSILSQTYKEFELIIVDDGSTDGSKAIIDPFLKDKRVRYVYQKNRGFSSAINTGIRVSKGNLIGFIGQDDLWVNNKLELQIKYFADHMNMHLVYSNYYYIDSDERIINMVRSRNPIFFSKKELINNLFLENFIGFETVLVKKECFDEVGFFDERMIACSDHDIWLRIAECFNIGYIDQFIVKKRQHKSQLSRNMEIVVRDEFLIVKNATEHYPSLKVVERAKIASLYYIWAIFLLRKGNIEAAKQKLLAVIRYQPWKLKAIMVYLLPVLYLKVSNLHQALGFQQLS